MKKFLVTSFYFVITTAVCAAGFWLPSTLSKYQDEQIYAKIERSTAEPMTLTYSSSLHDTLQLLSNEYYSVEYPYASSIHTEEEINKIVSKLLIKFYKYNILTQNLLSDTENAIQGQSVTLSLAIATGNAQNKPSSSVSSSSSDISRPASSSNNRIVDYTTAVIWDCTVYFQDSSLLLMSIDDKSGKLVGFNIYNSKSASINMGKKQLSKYANAVAKFLQDYYGMKAHVTLKEMREIAYPKTYDKQSPVMESVHLIDLKEDSGDTIQLQLINSSHQINFN